MRFIRSRLMQFVVDGLVVVLALAVAYLIRFEGSPPRHYIKQFLLLAPYLVLLRVGFGWGQFETARITVRRHARNIPTRGTGLASVHGNDMMALCHFRLKNVVSGAIRPGHWSG